MDKSKNNSDSNKDINKNSSSIIKEIILWPNGKKSEHYLNFHYTISKIITLQQLKKKIRKFLKKHISLIINLDSLHIFTQKGIELEESDIPYIYFKQILFILKNEEEFNSSNHYYQYDFIKWIKSGGYGKVYLAKHIITNEEYAIKQINTKTFSAEDVYNISRENVILQSFSHRNIIKCHHSFSYDNHFFTVMSVAKGGELGRLVKEKGGLKEGEAKKIFKQIYNAVNYIHRKNIIHRDLKPNNILFLNQEQTEVVLIDFGISGFSNGNSKEKIYAGTTRFLAPEIASGSTFHLTPKLDVWALGIILYFMLYNTFPFNGKNDKEMCTEITTKPVKFNNKVKISEECKDLIKDMLQKNHLFRIGMDSEMFDEWFNKKDIISFIDNYAQGYKVMIRRESSMRHSLLPMSKNIRQHIDEYLSSNNGTKEKEKDSDGSGDNSFMKHKKYNSSKKLRAFRNIALLKNEVINLPLLHKPKDINNNYQNSNMRSSIKLRSSKRILRDNKDSFRDSIVNLRDSHHLKENCKLSKEVQSSCSPSSSPTKLIRRTSSFANSNRGNHSKFKLLNAPLNPISPPFCLEN